MELFDARAARAVAPRGRRGAFSLGLVGLLAGSVVVLGAGATGADATPPGSVSGVSTDAQPTQTLYDWGDFGEKGPVSPKVDAPEQVTGIPGTIEQVDTSNAATYVLETNGTQGTVYAFGANGRGELGNGTKTSSFSTPVQVQFPPGVSIAWLPSPMPFSTGMAVDTAGRVWGWGNNSSGSLCLGDTKVRLHPTLLPFSDVTAATGAGQHASFVADGQLYSCGSGKDGELGTGNTASSTVPVPVALSDVSELSSSYADTAALLGNGTWWDWGNNGFGQLGIGTQTNSEVPVPVPLGGSVVSGTVGGNTAKDGQTFVTLSNGEIMAWGSDLYGQLCDGRTSPAVLSPEPITAPAGSTWSGESSGGGTTYMLDTKKHLWACGENNDGEAGVGSIGGNVVTPTIVLSNVNQVSSTSRNVAALQTTGRTQQE
jgi:alpha-tubulin suppressor-like RCC1 family protein